MIDFQPLQTHPHHRFEMRFLNKIFEIEGWTFVKMKYHSYLLALSYIFETFDVLLIDNYFSPNVGDAPVA